MADQFEYRLNQAYLTKRMPVPFTPDVVFIYNPSNATLFLNTTTYAIPTTTQYDMSLPPNSYTIFVPYTPNTEYGGLLVVPGGGAVEWDCWIEFRKGEKELDWNITPGFPVIQPLSPLPDPAVIAGWTYSVAPIPGWCRDYDFVNSSAGWSTQGADFGTYIPGVGFQQTATALQSTLALVAGLFPVGCRPTSMIMDYTLSGMTGTATVALQIQLVNPTETFVNAGIANGSHAQSYTFSGLAHRQISLSIAETPFHNGSVFTITHIEIEGIGVDIGTGVLCTTSGGIVQFDSSSSVGDIAFYIWNFGDGSPEDFTANPSHTYAADGVYTVTLCVIGVYGSIDCLSADIYVNAVAPDVLNFV